MNPKLAHLLTRLYPQLWRARYGPEFAAYLQTCEGGVRACVNVIFSAMHEHLLPTVRSDTYQGARWVHAWCVRAPWAMFLLAPLAGMACAYCVACLYLWLGWNVFLPGANTPFGHGAGPVYGVQNIYFQTGKFLYFGVPILVGWATALIAARHRVRPIWPVAGFLLITWMGCAAHIDANRASVPWSGHVSMAFPLATSLHDLHQDPSHAATILVLTVLPYILWRLQETRSSSI